MNPPAPTSNDRPWDENDASLLRALRDQSGLSRSELADKALISRAQLAQLEEGGESLFYSQRIKLRTGHRVLAVLGATRPVPLTAAQSEHNSEPRRELRQASRAPLAQTDAPARREPVAPSARSGAVRTSGMPQSRKGLVPGRPGPVIPLSAPQALGLAAGLSAVLVALSLWQEDPAPAASGQTVVSNSALPATMPLALLETGPDASRAAAAGPPAQAQGAATPAAGVDPLADTPPAPGSPPPGAAAPRVDPAFPPTVAASAPTPGATATVALDPRPAGRVLEVNRVAHDALMAGCPAGHEPPVTVESPPGQRPSTYVHVVATEDATVCVRDAKGQVTLLSLRAGQARSVHGMAPWNLSATDLGLLELYFQGRRIRPQDPDARHLRLKVVTAESSPAN